MSPAQAKAKKLNIKIIYNREHPFHPEPDTTVGAVREEAMDFFDIVADRPQLRLFRQDNTELDDGREIGSYDLAEHEVLILRQPQGGRLLMLQVSATVLQRSFDQFRSCGAGKAECVVYWLGPRESPELVDEVTHPLHTAHVGGYDVDGAWQNELWVRLVQEERELKAQIHTHPGAAFHSSRDDRMAALQIAGFKSLVIPNFGMNDVGLAGAHLAERDSEGGWNSTDPETAIRIEE